jgi:nucleoid DNA-binding protein
MQQFRLEAGTFSGRLYPPNNSRRRTLNRNQLIKTISKGTKLTKKQAGAALEATLDAITDAMKKGQKVALIGFGTFSSALRKARKGINPRTRKAIKIAAKRVPKFKAGKKLAKLVSKLK